MKRTWRFLKWCFTGLGLFEWYMLSISFCLSAGLTAIYQGNETLKNFWFGCLVIVISLAVITFMVGGIISAWHRFIEHDERAFNILKDKDLK